MAGRGRRAAGRSAVPGPQRRPSKTRPLAPDFQGCGHPDPDHSFQGGRVEYDGGACDGWLRAGSNDGYAIGYYKNRDLAFLGRAAPQWTAMDRYFAAIMAETFPNRIYQHAAQTDRLTNTYDISVLPTIWDRLADKQLEGRYYYSDVPFLALWGTKYLPSAVRWRRSSRMRCPATCPRSRSSTRASSTKRAAPPATTIPTPTSATARRS